MTAIDMDCLSDETLAAFVDGELDDSERAAVFEHLAVCGECRSNMGDAREISEAEQKILADEERKIAADEPSEAANGEKAEEITEVKENVRPFRDRKNRWGWIAGPIAATLLIVVAIPRPTGIEKVAEASESFETRKTHGRVTGDYSYKVLKPNMRAGEPKSFEVDTLPLLQVKDKLQKARRPDPHALGVALLLLGERNDAITKLNEALARNPADSDAIKQNLAVALMQQGDYEGSLRLSNELWAKAQTPAIAWNRAYALQWLGEHEKAITAWNDYLTLDPSSEWAQEAVAQRAKAEEDLKLDRDLQLRRP